jgi:hypothetical protein
MLRTETHKIPAPFRDPRERLRVSTYAEPRLLTWSDKTPLAWLSPQTHLRLSYLSPANPQTTPPGRSKGRFPALLVNTESVVDQRDKVGLSSCQASVGVSPTVDGSSQLSSHGSCKGPLARWTPSLWDLLRRSDLATRAEKAPQGPKWAGGPNLKDFGGPPMTARTPAGRLCSHRSLTVVYRGGPGGPSLGPPAPDPPKAWVSMGT